MSTRLGANKWFSSKAVVNLAGRTTPFPADDGYTLTDWSDLTSTARCMDAIGICMASYLLLARNSYFSMWVLGSFRLVLIRRTLQATDSIKARNEKADELCWSYRQALAFVSFELPIQTLRKRTAVGRRKSVGYDCCTLPALLKITHRVPITALLTSGRCRCSQARSILG